MTREMLPTRRAHELMDFYFEGIGHTVGLGYFEHDESRLAEVFIDTHKHGTAMAANARDAAVLLSIALQHGAPLSVIYHALNRERAAEGSSEPGKPSGVGGAALDRLLLERPDLFETPAAAQMEEEDARQTVGEMAPFQPDFLHLKSGNKYQALSVVINGTNGPCNGQKMVLYTNGKDLFVREFREFFDGRFERISGTENVTIGTCLPFGDKEKRGLLRAENESLHDQVAALSDELQKYKDDVKDRYRWDDAELYPILIRSMRQDRALKIASDIWGEEAVRNPAERLRRFFEEACELFQAAGGDPYDAERIYETVMDRKPGEFEQEVGGVAFTLLTLCAVQGCDAELLEVRELKRVLAKDPNTMRARHQEKVDAGLAMQARRPDDAA